MAWFKKTNSKNSERRVKIPEGLWIKCNNCKEIIYKKEVDRNLQVCPKCNYHFRITASERLKLLIDPNSFKEFAEDIMPSDPLGFKDTKPYSERLKTYQEKTGQKEAAIAGEAKIKGMDIIIV
ncbi:MAG: acetyl-CoA carboxylase carboxyl transferase subunit beta, partial [Nitrospirae bacterium]